MMHLEPLSRGPLLHVAENMREWDRREIFATRGDDDVGALVDGAMACGPVSWLAGHRLYREPIAAFGCAPLWPGVWSMWFFATNNLRTIGLSTTRLIVRDIIPMLWREGAHRLECRSMEGHVEAQDWLATLGAKREGTLKAYGKGREDFHVYVWERP